MNILFLTLANFNSVNSRGIYQDLLRELASRGHHIYAVSPMEGATQDSYVIEEDKATLLKVKIGKTQKTNVVRKGISTLLIEPQFKQAIKRFFADVRFDLVLYSTPPITLAGVVQYVKKRDRAATYLLLKDIFPQNAVDIGMMTKSGVKGLLYRHFRRKEKMLYALSDRIGCMSEANRRYILDNNPDVSPDKVEVCPNCVEMMPIELTAQERMAMRSKYGIPSDKTVFVYGGNLGKPQGIPFLMECLASQQTNTDAFFLIVGDGTEYPKLERFFEEHPSQNMALMKALPKEDYDRMIAACDVGLIFLDHRFTIPNFPSRLLSYMQAGLPVIACTDPHTDIGQVIEEGGFGWWCESNDVARFGECVRQVGQADCAAMKERALAYLQEHYTVQKGCDILLKDR